MTATTFDFTSEWCRGPGICTDFRCPAQLVSAASSKKQLFICASMSRSGAAREIGGCLEKKGSLSGWIIGYPDK